MTNTKIRVGSKFPIFNLPSSDADNYTNEQINKQFVLFVYPTDGTPSCTKEAIGFSNHVDDFDNFDTLVIGLSKDGINKHKGFIKKNNLKINLLSDENLALIKSLGCWTEKAMYGKTYMGTERTTFLVSKEGLVLHIWHKVKVPGHVEEVLNTVKQLG